MSIRPLSSGVIPQQLGRLGAQQSNKTSPETQGKNEEHDRNICDPDGPDYSSETISFKGPIAYGKYLASIPIERFYELTETGEYDHLFAYIDVYPSDIKTEDSEASEHLRQMAMVVLMNKVRKEGHLPSQ